MSEWFWVEVIGCKNHLVCEKKAVKYLLDIKKPAKIGLRVGK